MNKEILIGSIICIVVSVIWGIVGAVAVKGFSEPKTAKQSLLIFSLCGPIGIITMLVMLTHIFIKRWYNKLGE